MSERTFDDALAGLESGGQADADPGAPRGEAADPMSHPTVAALRAAFGDVVLHHTVMSGDEHVVYVHPDRIRDVLQWLRDEAEQRYDLLLDVSAVDYAGGRPLEVFYQLWSIPNRRALRVKATLPLAALEIDSAVPVWSTANWLERETYDMFGIHFRGHPDLRRIMMPDNYAEGHPLRKDFPLRGRFSRAEQTRRSLSMAVEDFYTDEELRTAGVPGPGPAGAVTGPAQPAEPVPDPGSPPHRPNDPEEWSLGTAGSAADGVPGPEGTGS